MIPSAPSPNPPEMAPMIPPGVTFIPTEFPVTTDPVQSEPLRYGVIPWETIARNTDEAAFERLSSYLEDQSSIAGFSMEVLGESTNDVRTADWINEHASVVGSRRSGSAADHSPPG